MDPPGQSEARAPGLASDNYDCRSDGAVIDRSAPMPRSSNSLIFSLFSGAGG